MHWKHYDLVLNYRKEFQTIKSIMCKLCVNILSIVRERRAKGNVMLVPNSNNALHAIINV